VSHKTLPTLGLGTPEACRKISPAVRVLCVPGVSVGKQEPHPEGGARTGSVVYESRRSSYGFPLFADVVRGVFLVLEADVAEQFGIRHERVVQRNGPGSRIRLGIINCNLDV